MGKGLDYVVNVKDGDVSGASKVKTAMQGIDNAVVHTQQVVNSLTGVINKVNTVLNGGLNVKNVTGAIEHLASAMGGNGPSNLKGASALLATTLQQPLKGFAALLNGGKGLDTEQKALTGTVSKHTKAQHDHANVLQRVQTEIGKSSKMVSSAMKPVNDLHGAFGHLGKGLGDLINNGLDEVTPALSAVTTVTEGLSAAQNILTGVQNTLAGVQTIVTAGQEALNIAMDANPIGLIVTGIGLLIAGLYTAYEKSENFRAIIAGLGGVAGSVMTIFSGLGEMIKGVFTLDGDEIKKGFQDASKGVSDLVSGKSFMDSFNAKKASDKKEKEAEEKKKGQNNAVTNTDNHLTSINSGFTKAYNTAKQTIPGKSGKATGHDSPSLTGGTAAKTIHITINKLVEKLEFHTTNIKGITSADIKKQVTDLLVSAVNDSQLALSSK